jgi:hypothetical protein
MGSVIYVIQEQPNGPVKIGYTEGDVQDWRICVKGRLESLQTGNPRRLAVVAVFDGNMKVERALHAKFWSFRLRGEWFEYVDEVCAFVETHRLKAPMSTKTRRVKPPKVREAEALTTAGFLVRDMKMAADAAEAHAVNIRRKWL